MELRPYQQAVISAIHQAREQGKTRLYYVLPTGTGKTATFTELIKQVQTPGHPSLVLAHREELLDQARASILRASPDLVVGVERSACKAPRHCDVIVASIQSLSRRDSDRLAWLANIGASVIVCDEYHHFAAEGNLRVIKRLTAVNPRTLVVGCTATPQRLDQLKLPGECVYTYEIRDAIKDGYLCQIVGYRMSTDIDLSKVKTIAGDYSVKDLSQMLDTHVRTAKAIEHWEQIAKDRATIVFCVDVQHAHHAALAWEAKGYKVATITGEMKREDRKKLIAAYKAGSIQILTSCSVLTEGFDAPETSCVVMLRPTKSWSLYTQMVGRGTRIAPGKQNLIVLDVVDGTVDHSLEGGQQGNGYKPQVRKKPASVSGMLGLPDGIDLEGHTLMETAELRDMLLSKADLIAKYSPESYSDLVTILEQVDLLSGVTAKEFKSHIKSPYRWIQSMNGDWVLSIGKGKEITIKQSEKDQSYWYKILNVERDKNCVEIDSLNTPDLAIAFLRADLIVEKEWSADQLYVARENAKWRNQPPSEKQIEQLKKFGLDKNLIMSISRGEASAIISKRFAS